MTTAYEWQVSAPKRDLASRKVVRAVQDTYLLSPEGLFAIGEASPGSADRNRTLSARKLMEIEVPVPRYSEQKALDCLVEKVRAVRMEAQSAAQIRAALLPAVLHEALDAAPFQTARP